MKIAAVNPATGELVRSYEEMPPERVEGIIAGAQRAFESWRGSSFAERSRLMERAAALLAANRERYARLMTEEMGKPIAQARAEADKCAWACSYYAESAERFLREEAVETGEGRAFVCYRPLGVTLAIMPWNFPFWQAMRFAVPALMAGNAVLLKHAPNVPGSAMAIEGLFREAGFPERLFSTLLIDVPAVERLIADRRVRMVSLTGSVGAGRSVAALAGRHLKKTVLELGGSDPYVVLADADLEQAASTCTASRLINSGQSCIAAKRFIVVEPLAERFRRLVVERMRAAVIGDPLDEKTEVGPMAREDLRANLHRQVTESVKAGAELLVGGKLPGGPGFYYPPTVLAGVRRGMPAYEEELFGPAAAIITARDEEEAIAIANDSPFGLGGAVFTADRARGEVIASQRIDSGAVFVNAYVKSDPRLPFGGVKDSGYGRELSSFGIREYVNVKTVWVT